MKPEDIECGAAGFLARNDAWREAREQGFDMSLIEANLRMTPAERIRQHARALQTALLLRSAMEEKLARSRESS